MKITGECPECGAELGIKVEDSAMSLFSDSVKRILDKDGNAVLCSNPECEEDYVEPEDVTIED